MFYIITGCTLLFAMFCSFMLSLLISKRIDHNSSNNTTELDRL